MKKYYIIGAGLSGLRIGQLLASAGNIVEVFEKDRAVGGLMKTERKDDFLFDIGPHIFFQEHADEYRDLIGDDLHNIKVLYGIGFNGKDIVSPIRPANLIKNLGARQSFFLIRDLLQKKLNNGKRESGHIDSAEKWAISNFGKEAYRQFFRDYISKVMELPAANITEEWGTERHKFYKEHNLWEKSVKFFLNFIVNQDNRGGYLDVYYPELGARQIPDAIFKGIEKLGGRVHLSTIIDKIEVNEGKVSYLTIIRQGNEEKIKVEDESVVVSTIPITDLFSALTSSDNHLADTKKESKGLRYRNLWIYNLVLKRKELKDKAQIYFPESKYIFKRVYEPKNLLKTPVNIDNTALCVEVGYSAGDEIESLGEEKLYLRVMEGLKEFYNISDADVLDMWSKKIPYAYSIYEIGYRERLGRLARYLINIDNLISFGRQGSFRYNHMTNRVMDSCEIVYKFIKSGLTKREYLGSPEPKSDFY